MGDAPKRDEQGIKNRHQAERMPSLGHQQTLPSGMGVSALPPKADLSGVQNGQNGKAGKSLFS